MKASITRTLQAPQYAPITMTLEEECTPDTFVLTLNKLADLIENTLRERYPQYSNVLPIVEKKEVAPTLKQSLMMPPMSHGQVLRNVIAANKVITIQKGEALIECINHCTSLEKLQSYEKDLDSDAAEIAYNDKLVQLQNNNTLCTQ